MYVVCLPNRHRSLGVNLWVLFFSLLRETKTQITWTVMMVLCERCLNKDEHYVNVKKKTWIWASKFEVGDPQNACLVVHALQTDTWILVFYGFLTRSIFPWTPGMPIFPVRAPGMPPIGPPFLRRALLTHLMVRIIFFFLFLREPN